MYNIADIVARHGRMKYTVGHKVKNINLTSQLFLLLLTLRERGRSHRETLGARVPPEFYSFSQNSVNNDLKHFILTRKNLKFLWRRDTVFSPDLFPDGKEHPSPHLTHKCSLHRDPLTLLSENAAFNLVMEWIAMLWLAGSGAAEERCPFQGAYHFIYSNNSGGECRTPTSYVTSCASESRQLWTFRHCQDAAYTYDRGLPSS